MTAGELSNRFGDRDTHVRFVLEGARLEVKSTTSSESGDVVVELRPAPRRKYMFRLTFEANPVIEAESLEEATTEAYRIMGPRQVRRMDHGPDGELKWEPDANFVAQEPYLLEEMQ